MIGSRFIRAAVLAASFSVPASALADSCDPSVQTVMDQQTQSFIAANGDLASQNFSHRPGSFASTTCLDQLMKSGGLDIFFKPPSLDGLLGLVKNMACEQASQIFGSITGTGLNGTGVLNPGEILQGINLGGTLSSFSLTSTSSMSSSEANIQRLFQ